MGRPTSLRFGSTLLITILGIAPALAADQEEADKRQLLGVLIKEKLLEELPKVHFKDSRSGRETKTIKNPFKDIVIHTDWEISAGGSFVDLDKRLKVEVTRMQRQAGGTLVTVSAAAPIAGTIWGEIKTVGKTKFDFSAVANMELEARLKRKKGSDTEFEAEVVAWRGSFSEVSIRPDVAGVLSGKARDTANKALADQNERLKQDANRALSRVASEGRLRLEP